MGKTASAFLAIVGRPNVGKSSLLNRFVGEKVAIVSPKPQTTRTRITGVLTQEDTQFVFIDTPGLHNPKTKLSEFMVKQIKDSVADVDAAVLVTEPLGKIHPTELELLQRFRDLRLPAILVINKIDTIPKKDMMMEKIAAFSELFPFEAVVPVSALNGDGLPQLLDELSHHTKEGPHYFPDDAMTDQPERVIIAEIIREKLLNCLNEEIPHGTAVTIEQMTEREHQNLIDIHAVIYCEKDSHKRIIIGKQGTMLKKIASQARREIESFLGVKINLQCWVKVKEDWRNRPGIIRDLGFRES
ncbi:MAG: GTPase Era [Oscillospiraceae bacterium]|jgi:GTP-binding protein Era|nr:GTPase Era [Oscillospiraceae bacterium]MDD7040708.1 GTPase Era [Oscillospiraceae bacterium]MDY2611429.1 GTPase Era [Oscillospiraceae bacterium]